MYYPIKTRLLSQKYRNTYIQYAGNTTSDFFFPDTLYPPSRNSYDSDEMISNFLSQTEFTASYIFEQQTGPDSNPLFSVPTDHIYTADELAGVIRNNTLLDILIVLSNSYNQIIDAHDHYLADNQNEEVNSAHCAVDPVNNTIWLFNLRYLIVFANYAAKYAADNIDQSPFKTVTNRDDTFFYYVMDEINYNYPLFIASYEKLVCQGNLCTFTSIQPNLCNCGNDFLITPLPFDPIDEKQYNDVIQQFQEGIELILYPNGLTDDPQTIIDIPTDNLFATSDIINIIKNNTLTSVYIAIIDAANDIIKSNNNNIPFVTGSYCNTTNPVNNTIWLQNVSSLLLYANYAGTNNVSFLPSDSYPKQNDQFNVIQDMLDNKITTTFFRAYEKLVNDKPGCLE